MDKIHFLVILCVALLVVGNLQAQGVHVTSIGNLNTDAPVINSHENDTGAKLLELNYREYHEVLISSSFNSGNPTKSTYTRIKKLPNGKYIMFWHINDVGSNILYSTSPNLKDWEVPKEVFTPIQNIMVTVQGQQKADRRTYNTADALVLQNGDLMVVASFRANTNLYSTNDGNGIAMRISKDNGQTWGEVKDIFRGMNWEPQILQLPSGEIQVYFTHSSTNNQMQFDKGIVGNALVRSSGTAIIRSFDNGETWESHLPENEFYGQVIAQRFTKTEKDVNRYTHQMPCAVLLNNTNTIALVTEDDPQNTAQYQISISYSTDNWAHYMNPNSVFGEVEEGPADKQLGIWGNGAAPYLKQFPSGETVVSYNTSKYTVRLGDAQARAFTQPYEPFRHGGYWGALEPDGSHTMIGTVTTAQISNNNRHILIGKMQLNHTIFPTNITPTIDGNNDDWANNTDAFFVGSDSQAQAAVRMAYDDDNLYLLVERLDDDLLPSDVLDIYLHAGTGALNSSSLRLKIGTEGVQQIARYSEEKWMNVEAPEIQSQSLVLGTVSNSNDSDEGYIAEVAIPRSVIQANGSIVKIAFVLFNQDDGTEAIEDELSNINLNLPDGWLKMDNPKAGACGDDLLWTFVDGTLTISGWGDMWNFPGQEGVPWVSERASITSVNLSPEMTSIGNYTFSGCENLTSINLPGSITALGDFAFSGCTELTSIEIPENVGSIGDRTFYLCSKLTAIETPESNTAYTSKNGILFNKTKTTLIQYPEEKTEESYSIPESVTTIGNYAFAGCDELHLITIPEDVISIGDSAFARCNNLTINVKAKTPPSLGDGVFYEEGVSIVVALHVPCGTESAYLSDADWILFLNADIIAGDISPEITLQSNDETMGEVTFEQENSCENNNTAIIKATANPDHYFVKWNDGDQNNPRTITIAQDITLTAEFAPLEEYAPILLTDLDDASVCAGESHTFEIKVKGENLTYEWYFNNKRIPGANKNTYTVTDANSGNYGNYHAIVRTEIGDFKASTYSKNVRLWVANPLPETLQFSEFPNPAVTGKTYHIKLFGYSDVTQYVWSYSNDGVTFSPETGGIGQNETLATFGVLSKGTGVLKATLTHPCGTREATQTILVNYPTGIEEVTVNEIAVSPNPTQGIIKVSGTKSNQIIRVVDITGSLKGTYPTQDGETTIDLSNHSKGTYLIQYDGKTIKAVKK
ncbi:MAG: leucine-rich repeat protein [Dysgonamonadaceae bacterium]|jgi:hypothetical protein|nr:leucine-rich repeat protein [Dysgonamonadaceae bacterium]